MPTILMELLAALPAGAAEAVVSQGLDSLISRVRADPEVSNELAEDLEAVAADDRPSRALVEVGAELAEVVNVLGAGAELHQQAGAASSQLAVGGVGGDLYVNHPHRPPQR
jgi:hypothetical protein